jgi:phosphohistidine phosphatase
MAEPLKHRLLLVRHSKSDYPYGVADHDRPLNDRGRRDAPFIGSWISKNVPLSAGDRPIVLVSSANRAQLTWQRATNGLSGAWTECEVRTEPLVYEAGLRRLLDLVAALPEDAGTAVIVGHNPTMRDVVAMVCEEDELQQQAIVKYPTSAIAVMTTSLPWLEAVSARTGFRLEAYGVPRAQ